MQVSYKTTLCQFVLKSKYFSKASDSSALFVASEVFRELSCRGRAKGVSGTAEGNPEGGSGGHGSESQLLGASWWKAA